METKLDDSMIALQKSIQTAISVVREAKKNSATKREWWLEGNNKIYAIVLASVIAICAGVFVQRLFLRSQRDQEILGAQEKVELDTEIEARQAAIRIQEDSLKVEEARIMAAARDLKGREQKILKDEMDLNKRLARQVEAKKAARAGKQDLDIKIWSLVKDFPEEFKPQLLQDTNELLQLTYVMVVDQQSTWSDEYAKQKPLALLYCEFDPKSATSESWEKWSRFADENRIPVIISRNKETLVQAFELLVHKTESSGNYKQN